MLIERVAPHVGLEPVIRCYLHGCPCGDSRNASRECRRTGGIIQRYLGRISGPLLERIDFPVEAPAVPDKELRANDMGVTSEQMRDCVLTAARERRQMPAYQE